MFCFLSLLPLSHHHISFLVVASPSSSSSLSVVGVYTVSAPAGVQGSYIFTISCEGNFWSFFFFSPPHFLEHLSFFLPFPLGIAFTGKRTATVIPGVVSPKDTSFSQINTGLAGVSQNVTISLFDASLNPVNTAVTVVPIFSSGRIVCSDVEGAPLPSASTLFTDVLITSLGLGVYTLTFTPLQVGDFTLNLTLNNAPLPCPAVVALTVTSGLARGAYSTIDSGTFGTLTAGKIYEYAVTVRDRFGNRVYQNTDTINFGDTFSSRAFPSTQVITTANAIVAFENTPDPANTQIPVGNYKVTLQVRVAGNYTLQLGVNGEAMAVRYALLVVPGPASSVTPYTVDGTAAIPVNFTVQSADAYGNAVEVLQDFTFRFQETVTSNLLADSFVKEELLSSPLGATQVTFLPSRGGRMDITVTPASGTALSANITLRSAMCAADNLPPYRCPTFNGTFRTCVSNYTQCPDILSALLCPAARPYLCSDGGCVTDPALCTCYATADGFTTGVRCPLGDCQVSSGYCLKPNPCLDASLIQCPNSGPCRKSLSDCPSIRACPTGYALCPDGTSCLPVTIPLSSPLNTCPFVPSQLQSNCSGEFFFRCPSGACVMRFEDCPTGKTCPSGQVVCPDGSCQSGPSFCPPEFKCYSEFGLGTRCQDGTCRASVSDCPTQTTCPVGYVLCEHGKCAASVTACGSSVKCSLNQTRCSDGSCRDSPLLCPTGITCPADSPVRCPDGTCTVSISLCASPSPCPSTSVTCPDGSCAADFSFCPTAVTCPLVAPIRCPDGDCKPALSDCKLPPQCPTATPVRCPDGSCRGSTVDCPSHFACPSATPVRCLDSQCVTSIDRCNPIANMTCPSGTIRCPGGECALSTQVCPTHVTCSGSTHLCPDGTCRITCPSDFKQCESKVACPQAGAGLNCAFKVSECPQGVVCPSTAPVRCVDSSCAATASNCPTIPTTYRPDKVPCPDGSFESDSSNCGTPVTCVSDAPFKCWDDTCRKNPLDCPPTPKCTSDAPFLCPDGSCKTQLTDCRSTSTDCGSNTPVRCPDGNCVDSLASCPSVFTVDPTIITPCPNSRFRCRDGSCRGTPSLCETLKCDSIIPYLCSTGQCVFNASQCPLENGCDPSTPVKCEDGRCVNSTADCSAGKPMVPCSQVGDGVSAPYRCPDGSCTSDKTLSTCAKANGCPARYVLCADRRCAKIGSNYPAVSPCTSATTTQGGLSIFNSCPPSRPYRCPRGFCGVSSSLCPSSLTPTGRAWPCSASKPILCDDGSCVLSASQCPLIVPCDPATPYRCGDGTCRASSYDCPTVDTCPIGYDRCGGVQGNGLCKNTNGDQLSGPTTCFNETTGCFAGIYFSIKCPDTGACVTNADDCTADALTKPAPSNGCPSAQPYKCQDGSCTTGFLACPDPNGCPRGAPYRCPSGVCQTDPGLCSSSGGCPNTSTVCADGQCKSNAAACSAANGCPIQSPIRCVDGSCATYSALSGYNHSCPITITCGAGTVRCADGSCASLVSLCPPAINKCPGKGAYLCPDGKSCGNSLLGVSCPTLNVCPPRVPVTCPSGACATSIADCPPRDAVTCSGSTPFKCFDGKCRSSPLECIRWSRLVHNGSIPDDFNANAVDGAVCTTPGEVLCSDGSCVPQSYLCPVLPACSLTQSTRCADGSCANGTSQCTVTLSACVTGTRCADGACRLSCLGFHGCSPGQIFPLCFAQQTAASTVGRWFARVSHAAATSPSICISDCSRDVKPSLQAYTVTFGTTSTVSVAVDSRAATRLSVTISSGAFQLPVISPSGSDNSSIVFRPVPDSILVSAINTVDNNRQAIEGLPSSLPYAMTVLSPVFECIASSDVVQPFPVALIVTADIDRSPLSATYGDSDVCLAQLVSSNGVLKWVRLCVIYVFPLPLFYSVDVIVLTHLLLRNAQQRCNQPALP